MFIHSLVFAGIDPQSHTVLCFKTQHVASLLTQPSSLNAQHVSLVECCLLLDKATLHLRHRAHHIDHRLLILEAQRLISRNTRRTTHVVDICLCVVAIRRGCPSSDDLADRVRPSLLDVGTQQLERRPIAILTCLELHERLVRLLLRHAQPLALAVADVQWVVVAEASCQPPVRRHLAHNTSLLRLFLGPSTAHAQREGKLPNVNRNIYIHLLLRYPCLFMGISKKNTALQKAFSHAALWPSAF